MTTATKKREKKRNLQEAVDNFDFTGWVKHTIYHYQLRLFGAVLDYWPSASKWMYKGELHSGDSEDLKEWIDEQLGKHKEAAAPCPVKFATLEDIASLQIPMSAYEVLEEVTSKPEGWDVGYWELKV